MANVPTARVASSSSLRDIGTDSDPDNRERPVREKLQQTSIDTTSHETTPSRSQSDRELSTADPDASTVNNDPSLSGNPRKPWIRRKRSYEDVDASVDGQTGRGSRHTRKKSRDLGSAPLGSGSRQVPAEATIDEHDQEGGGALLEVSDSNASSGPTNRAEERPVTPPSESNFKDTITSPKNKRNRDEFQQDNRADPAVSGEGQTTNDSVEIDVADEPSEKVGEERKPKRQRDSGSPQPRSDEEIDRVEKKPVTAFTNTSATSPFGSLSKHKSAPLQTSSSAFAASGLSALSSSASSPFGSISGSQHSKSPFGAGIEKKGLSSFASVSTESSAFGPALANPPKSLFATNTNKSGFSGLDGTLAGSTFGGVGTGGRLTSFAGGAGPSISGLGGKIAKPFGAHADEEEEDEASGADDEEADVQSPHEDKKDPRFHEQEISTGEEAEDEVFKCRAKLYNYAKTSDKSDKKEWKERGVGDIKLLATKSRSDKSDHAVKARFVMRADKSHRLLLNSPILKNGKYGTAEGDISKSGYLLFMGTIDEKPLETLQFKMKVANAEEMWKQISAIQKEM